MDTQKLSLVKYNLLHVFFVVPLLLALAYNQTASTPSQKVLKNVAYIVAIFVLMAHLYFIKTKLNL